MSTPTFARYALRAAPAVDVRLTLPFGEAARRAAQAVYGRLFNRAASPAFSGKEPGGAPLAEHRHAFFLPADEDGDGALDHLTLWAAGGFGPSEQQALTALDQVYLAEPRRQVALECLPGAKADPIAAALLRTARAWRSVTPFVPTRHYKERGTKRDAFPRGQLAERNLREELARRGLPDLVRVERLDACFLDDGRELPWREFRQRRVFGDGRRGSDFGKGFEIEFAEPVAGPLALGYACHYGLGLFTPLA